MSTNYLSVAKLAEELDVSYDHAKNLILGGHIPAVDTGTGQRAFWRVSRADLDAYISSKRAETARRFGAAS